MSQDDARYGLIELETGNMVGFFPTEQAALASVVDGIDRYGPEAAATLGLAHFVRDAVESVAEGDELSRRALAAQRQARPLPPAPRRRSRGEAKAI